MYVLDTNIFLTLGFYYPKRFPSVWERIDLLTSEEKLWSVKEVKRELDKNSHTPHIEEWVKNNKAIFKKPTKDEYLIVTEIFKQPYFQGIVRKDNILKGLPVADPFIVASAKINNAIVVTQEKYVKKGARIPSVCVEFDVEYINMEQFLEKEELEF